MNQLAYITWDVNPNMFSILGHPVAWYGLLFAVGLVIIGPYIAQRMWQWEQLEQKWLDQLFIYILVSTVLGARLGHVLFYDPSYYLANPSKILHIWEGGLASHGGTLGIIIAMIFYSKYVSKKPLPWVLDRLVVPTGLVAAMIRLGNLMNSEIFGRPTELPWGFRFLRSDEYRQLVPDMSLGCHPTQIYEALAYLLIFGLMMWLYWKRDYARRYSGMLVGIFLSTLFTARLLIEQIKIVQEPWELKMIATIGLNMGQLLSIPFIIGGLWLIWRAKRLKALEAEKN